MLVDGEPYYLYDKTANEKEWPFNIPQNIILNLAMGGGWGGAQGLDPI
jgi:beta-glucanase (GH16 family)